jgi:ABC-type branched-subunit amino acid transport system permease subunit
MPATGGDIGLPAIPRLAVASFELGADRDYAYLAWGALALVVLTMRNVITLRPGRALRALAASEVAAESSGVPVGRYKVTVFALAGAFAGLAGGIYAFYIGYVALGSFPVQLSFEYVVMAVVGARSRSSAPRRSHSSSSCSARRRPCPGCRSTHQASCRTRPIPHCSSSLSCFCPMG